MQKPGVEGKAGQVASGVGSGAQSAVSESANLGRKDWGVSPFWAGPGWIGSRGCEALAPGLEKRRGVCESPMDPDSSHSAQTS